MQGSLPLARKPLRVGEHFCSTAGEVMKCWRHPKGLTVLLNYPASISFPAGFGLKAYLRQCNPGCHTQRGEQQWCGAGRTPGTDSGTLPVTLLEGNGICVPHQPGPNQIYLFFFFFFPQRSWTSRSLRFSKQVTSLCLSSASSSHWPASASQMLKIS